MRPENFFLLACLEQAHDLVYWDIIDKIIRTSGSTIAALIAQCRILLTLSSYLVNKLIVDTGIETYTFHTHHTLLDIITFASYPSSSA
jgi:hypothetical protein